MVQVKHPKSSQVIMTEIVLPQHTNSLGTVFGGVVLSWIDISAAVCAGRHAESVVVTASIDAMHFLAPVKLGWVVNIRSSVNYAGKTSCEVGVKLTAENPLTQSFYHTASAYLTMVSLGNDGRPAAMPAIEAETIEEKRRYSEAIERRNIRLQQRPKF